MGTRSIAKSPFRPVFSLIRAISAPRRPLDESDGRTMIAAFASAVATAKEGLMRTRPVCLPALLFLTVVIAPDVRADEAFVRVPLEELKLVDGQLPQDPAVDRRGRNGLDPYAVVDGEGEAF